MVDWKLISNVADNLVIPGSGMAKEGDVEGGNATFLTVLICTIIPIFWPVALYGVITSITKTIKYHNEPWTVPEQKIKAKQDAQKAEEEARIAAKKAEWMEAHPEYEN